jgi:hypothetical protein
MSGLWQTWVSEQAVDEFLADVDELIAAGAFPDRRAAFLAYAGYVFSELGLARWGPDLAEDGLSAAELADRLLAHASAVERRGRNGRSPPRRVRARGLQSAAACPLRDDAGRKARGLCCKADAAGVGPRRAKASR